MASFHRLTDARRLSVVTLTEGVPVARISWRGEERAEEIEFQIAEESERFYKGGDCGAVDVTTIYALKLTGAEFDQLAAQIAEYRKS